MLVPVDCEGRFTLVSQLVRLGVRSGGQSLMEGCVPLEMYGMWLQAEAVIGSQIVVSAALCWSRQPVDAISRRLNLLVIVVGCRRCAQSVLAVGSTL